MKKHMSVSFFYLEHTFDGDVGADFAATVKTRSGWMMFKEPFAIPDIHSSLAKNERPSIYQLCRMQHGLCKRYYVHFS